MQFPMKAIVLALATVGTVSAAPTRVRSKGDIVCTPAKADKGWCDMLEVLNPTPTTDIYTQTTKAHRHSASPSARYKQGN